MPTSDEQALQLFLAGVPAPQIAETLRVPVGEVAGAVSAALTTRQPGQAPAMGAEIERFTALWRKVYTEGVKGDLDAARLALQISQHLQELRSHADVQQPAATPGAGIRDAWSVLAFGAADAAASLVEVARSGRSEQARISAATALLSRVGITEKVEVAASVRMYAAQLDEGAVADAPQTAGDVIRQRLAMLAERDRQLSTIDAEPE